MEFFETMIETYGTIFILLGAFADTFFLLGYFLYGFALMGSVVMLHASGHISTLEIIVFAYPGTLLASYINYAAGYYLSHYKLVQKVTNSPKVDRLTHRLTGRNLFLAMTIGRFITFSRPAYMLILGSLRISRKTVFAYEAVIAFVWIIFWTGVLVFGENFILWLVRTSLSII